MRSYEAARNLFSFLGFCASVVIIIGGIVAFIGGSAASNGFRGQTELQVLLGAAPGAIIALAGFFGLALVQIGRASVDSAEYGQQALEVSRQQLEVSRDVLVQGKAAATSYSELLKRQPAARANSAGTSINANLEPSYGNRDAQAKQSARQTDDDAQAISTEQDSDATAQLEHTSSMAADHMLSNDEVATSSLKVSKFRDSFVVGNKAFKTEREAEAYASANAS